MLLIKGSFEVGTETRLINSVNVLYATLVLEQGLLNYSLWATSCLWPDVVKKIVLEHSVPICSCVVCGCLPAVRPS